MAAVAYLEERGAKKIFLIGASMGGLAVLRAARTPGVDKKTRALIFRFVEANS